MDTLDKAMAMGTRPLAQELLRTRGQGIAVFVQQRVHSTTVGLDATTAFVAQLLTELEDAVAILNVDDPATLQLSDDDEVELGTLISASSLTIRYVTERDAMTPVLLRFRDVFQIVLRFPLWTKALLGLKMVSLMGLTRLLESFGDHVDATLVASDLQWLFAQFASREGEDHAAFVERANYLFRPACEQLTVAVQSHPAIQQSVFDSIVPVLLELAPTFDADVSDAVAVELLSAVAVVFDLRLPSPTPSAFSLLPMPAFAQDKSTTDNADEENIHILQREDTESTSAATVTMANALVVAPFAEAVASWLSSAGRRDGAIANLPHICGAMVAAHMDASLHRLCQTLVQSFECFELQKPSDFEFFQSAVECVRDLGLRNAFPCGLERDIFAALKDVMPRLQAALKALDVDAAELRAIKVTCSKTRDVLVEAFVWWIHYAAATDILGSLWGELRSSVVDKLADPRVHGDLLFVSRRFLDDASFDAAVDAAVAPLTRAVRQLDRYSKVAASRVIHGVGRVAVGAGTSINSFADALAGPLLHPHARKAKASRINAVACLLLSCASDSSFLFEEHEWVQHVISVLLDASVSQNVQIMIVLDHLVRFDVRIRGVVADAASSSQEIVRHIVHNSLSSWPIFTEDLDAVLMVLAILSELLVEEQLRATIDVPAMATTIETLRTNADADEQTDLVEACDNVLKVLGRCSNGTASNRTRLSS